MASKKNKKVIRNSLALTLIALVGEFFAYYTYQLLIGVVPTLTEALFFTGYHTVFEGIVIFVAAYILFSVNNK